MGDAVEVLVARGTAYGTPALEALAPGVVRVRPGQELELKFAYRVGEVSAQKEGWWATLRTEVDARPSPPEVVHHRDRWALPDEVWGYVRQVHRFSSPGEHVVRWEAELEYDRGKWLGASDPERERRRVGGLLRVVV